MAHQAVHDTVVRTDELQSDEVLMGGNTLIVHAVLNGSPTRS